MIKKYLLLLLFLCVAVYYGTMREKRIDWDVFGYYLYLPAEFIYDDITLEKKDQWLNPIIEKYQTTQGFYQAYKGPKNIYVMKYTMGLAYAYAPFFFIADFSAPILGYEKDGFSTPYQVMMLIGSIIFSLIGIFYFLKILSLFYQNDIVIAIASIILFGSNYFIMATYDGLMPHNFVFTFYAIMLYYTIQWYRQQKIKFALIIGICIGISVLIRPTSIVVAIIPLLWGISNTMELKKRLLLLIKKWKHLIILCLALFTIILPQLLYWKSVTDEFLFYSYPDEKLNLLTPHLINVLFSYKKGWLLYTPIMIFGLYGFISLYKTHRDFFYAIFIFFIVNTYIISCWDCWWYGGSFAQRPFVESYVFMAFPLASFIKNILTKQLYIIIPIAFTGIFFLYLNLFQTNQALNGVIHTSLTTKEYYWRVFLKRSATEEDKRWLEPPQYGDERDELNSTIHYQTIYNANLVLDDYSAQLNSNNLFSKSLFLPTNLGYDLKDHYLRTVITIDTSTNNISPDINFHVVICINKNGKLYKYRSRDYRYDQIKSNGGNIFLNVLVPPQVNDKCYEIKSYAYVDNNTKARLLFFSVNVLASP